MEVGDNTPAIYVEKNCEHLKPLFEGKKFCSAKGEYFWVIAIYNINNIRILMENSQEIRFHKTYHDIFKSGKI